MFFRGRDSNKARLELVKQHRRNTELFDVGITNWFFFPYDEEVYGPKMKSVSFHDFFKVRTYTGEITSYPGLAMFFNVACEKVEKLWA